MELQETINEYGYISTVITTENAYETMLLVRTIYNYMSRFSKLITALEQKSILSSFLNFPIRVVTDQFQDIRADEVLKMLENSRKEISSLKSVEINGRAIQETVVLFTEEFYDRLFEERLGRIGIVLNTTSDFERRLVRMLLDSDLTLSHSYTYIDSVRYDIFLSSNKSDLRISEVEDLIYSAERDVRSLKKISKKWSEPSQDKGEEVGKKIKRKIRV